VAQQDPNRTITTSGLGAMQTALDNTKYIFSWWVHFLTLNSAPTLQFAQIPNAEGRYVTPNDVTIVSAITNHQGSPTDLFIMLCTCSSHTRHASRTRTSDVVLSSY
jgi:hypothetical protein